MNQTNVEWTFDPTNPIKKPNILNHKHNHTHVCSEITDLEEKLKILNILTAFRSNPYYNIINNSSGSKTNNSTSTYIDWTCIGGGDSPYSSNNLKYYLPRTILAIDKLIGYYLVSNITVYVYSCLDNRAITAAFKLDNTILNLKDNTFSNLYYAQNTITHNPTGQFEINSISTLKSGYINNSNFYKREEGYSAGDWNNRQITAKFSLTEDNIIFEVNTSAYGEENDHADTHIRLMLSSELSYSFKY